jgi:hypothetical protein
MERRNPLTCFCLLERQVVYAAWRMSPGPLAPEDPSSHYTPPLSVLTRSVVSVEAVWSVRWGEPLSLYSSLVTILLFFTPQTPDSSNDDPSEKPLSCRLGRYNVR